MLQETNNYYTEHSSLYEDRGSTRTTIPALLPTQHFTAASTTARRPAPALMEMFPLQQVLLSRDRIYEYSSQKYRVYHDFRA
jgi:hypothetical protein